jgi:hypothetical protein
MTKSMIPLPNYSSHACLGLPGREREGSHGKKKTRKLGILSREVSENRRAESRGLQTRVQLCKEK